MTVRRPSSPRCWLGLLAAACCLAAAPLRAVTMNELKTDSRLTPKKFANQFENFSFELFDYVQNPDVFLRTRNGDCDDYAILADHVLKPKGFDTRLIHVRMVGRVAHAVCYVTENRAYLDYNNRKYSFNLQRSGATIREIATKVAASFEANWTSASEFTYDYKEDEKHAKITVVKTDPPSQDADRVDRPNS